MENILKEGIYLIIISISKRILMPHDEWLHSEVEFYLDSNEYPIGFDMLCDKISELEISITEVDFSEITWARKGLICLGVNPSEIRCDYLTHLIQS